MSYDLLELIPTIILNRAKLKHPEFNKPSNIEYKGDIAIVTYDASNFCFFIRSSGHWSYEDRDKFRSGNDLALTNDMWIHILEDRGHLPVDASRAVSAWVMLVQFQPSIEILLELEES
jgi:hypothetical protein